MHNKHIFLLSLSLMTSTLAIAQPEPGTWSVTPKVGLTTSKWTGDGETAVSLSVMDETKYEELRASSDEYPNYELCHNRAFLRYNEEKYGLGFAGGVDFQYQLTSRWALTWGVNYSINKVKYDCDEAKVEYDYYPSFFTAKPKTFDFTMHYFHLPLMLKVYLYKGLAFSSGIQVSMLRQVYMKSESQVKFDNNHDYYCNELIKNAQPGKWYDVEYEKTRVSRAFNRFDYFIPVSLSYDFGHVVTDARVNIGMSDIFKADDNKLRTLSMQLTVGYRFDL